MTTQVPASNIKPLFTNFCTEAGDGWRYYFADYDSCVTFALSKMPYQIRCRAENKLQTTYYQEMRLEIKYGLPKGYLRGISEMCSDVLEVEHTAHNEATRLKDFQKGTSDSSTTQQKVKAHANFTVAHKLKADNVIAVKLFKEVVSEYRASCNCMLCLPLKIVTTLDSCRYCQHLKKKAESQSKKRRDRLVQNSPNDRKN